MKQPKMSWHGPSGRAYVTVQSKRIYLGKWDGRDPAPDGVKAKYRSIVGRIWLGMAADQGEVVPADLTIWELCARFLEEGKRTRSGHEHGKYDRITKILCERFGFLEAKAFGPVRLREFQDRLIELGFCRSVINKSTWKTVGIFAWGVSYGLIPAEVIVGLKTVPGLRRGQPGIRESKTIDLVPRERVVATLPFLTEKVRGMIEFAMATGCRIGEARCAKIGDIDRTGDPWIFRPKSHKNAWRGKIREIPLGRAALAVVKESLTALDPDVYLFASWTGRSYEQSAVARAVRAACKKAGVEQWAPRQIRKLVAQLTSDQVGIEHASALLGHSGIVITQKIYAKNQLDKAKAAVEKMDRIG